MLKKIKTAQEKERKRKRNQMLLGGGLILLMVLSTLGFSLMSGEGNTNDDVLRENGVDFYLQGGYFVAELGGQVTRFQHLPSQVQNVTIEGQHSLSDYSGKVIYFASGINGGANELLINLNHYFLRYQEACLDEENCSGNHPIKNCSETVIVFVSETIEDRIYKDRNCIYILGDPVRGADALIYEIFGIN